MNLINMVQRVTVLLNDFIKERVNSSNISYILEDNKIFFDTGYKVLQTQEKNGFVKCVKVIHNGKIKLVYDISRYKSLQSLMNQITAEVFLTILSKLLNILDEVDNNGFMVCDNIHTSLDKIFIDMSNLSVYLIYLPINTETSVSSRLNFENTLKNNIMKGISHHEIINNEAVSKLYKDLKSENVPLETLKSTITGFSTGGRLTSDTAKNLDLYSNKEEKAEKLEEDKLCSEEIIKNESKKKSSLFSKIFVFRKKESSTKSKYPAKFETAFEGGATEVLDDIFIPTIIFSGFRTTEKIEFVIDKPQFIIGKNPEAVHGVIGFNKAISRVHCKITYDKGKYYISDMGSSNGTFINSKRIQQGNLVEIKVGDIIKLANSEFIIKALY